MPASKCDSSALGVSITYGCCCQQAETGRIASPLCPYHLLKRHLLAYKRKWPRRFRRYGKARQGVPLFPDRFGRVCSKTGDTNTIRSAARRQGMATRDAGGLFLHSGHALRVAGSQAMSRAGLPEHTISLVARWGSAAVFTYIRKAPLASTHQLARVALEGWQLNRSASGVQHLGAPGARRIVAGRRSGVQR